VDVVVLSQLTRASGLSTSESRSFPVAWPTTQTLLALICSRPRPAASFDVSCAKPAIEGRLAPLCRVESRREKVCAGRRGVDVARGRREADQQPCCARVAAG
jgi:hypothetical protein